MDAHWTVVIVDPSLSWTAKRASVAQAALAALQHLPEGRTISTRDLVDTMLDGRALTGPLKKVFGTLTYLADTALVHCNRHGAPVKLYGKTAIPRLWHRPKATAALLGAPGQPPAATASSLADQIPKTLALVSHLFQMQIGELVDLQDELERIQAMADSALVELKLDPQGSASRQHFIDTGRYLTKSEAQAPQ